MVDGENGQIAHIGENEQTAIYEACKSGEFLELDPESTKAEANHFTDVATLGSLNEMYVGQTVEVKEVFEAPPEIGKRQITVLSRLFGPSVSEVDLTPSAGMELVAQVIAKFKDIPKERKDAESNLVRSEQIEAHYKGESLRNIASRFGCYEIGVNGRMLHTSKLIVKKLGEEAMASIFDDVVVRMAADPHVPEAQGEPEPDSMNEISVPLVYAIRETPVEIRAYKPTEVPRIVEPFADAIEMLGKTLKLTEEKEEEALKGIFNTKFKHTFKGSVARELRGAIRDLVVLRVEEYQFVHPQFDFTDLEGNILIDLVGNEEGTQHPVSVKRAEEAYQKELAGGQASIEDVLVSALTKINNYTQNSK